MHSTFTPAHRGGTGPPLVLLHGFMDTWRIWELTLPTLERRHDVLALTLPGHAGGPPVSGAITHHTMAGTVERAMDDAGFQTAHIAWELDAQRIECPARIVWGTADRLLPWPDAAARYRTEWLPHADWIELEGIGHCPPLDVPHEAAALILT